MVKDILMTFTRITTLLSLVIFVTGCYQEERIVKKERYFSLEIEQNGIVYDLVFIDSLKDRPIYWDTTIYNKYNMENVLSVFTGTNRNELDSFPVKPDSIITRNNENNEIVIYRYYRRRLIYNSAKKKYEIKNYDKPKRYIDVYLLNDIVVKMIYYNPVWDALP
jgi:hypothetical protein